MFNWHLPFLRSKFSTDSSITVELPPEVQLKAERIFKQFSKARGKEYAMLKDISLTLQSGDCIALEGPSLSQKLALLQTLNGQSSIDAGAIWVTYEDYWVNLARLAPLKLSQVRQHSIGYLGKFLPINPRVTVFEMALEPLLDRGMAPDAAQERVEQLFDCLDLPTRLWRISPATLSDREKQSVNLVRTFGPAYPVVLLNTPTFALDPAHRNPLIALINQYKAEGCGLIGIFQDEDLKAQVCTRTVWLENEGR